MPFTSSSSSSSSSRPRNSDTNYYAVLNVSRTASPAEIRRSYLRLSKLYHPNLQAHNRGPNAEANEKAATEKFHEVQRAYDTLIDEKTRVVYDMYGVEGLSVDWDLGKDVQTPEDLKERLRQQADLHAGVIGDPNVQRKSAFTMKTSALEMYDAASGRRFHWPETVGMLVSHGVNARFGSDDTISFEAALKTDQAESARGGFGLMWQHTVSPDLVVSSQVVSNGKHAALAGSVSHQVTASTALSLGGEVILDSLDTKVQLKAVQALVDGTEGYAELSFGHQSDLRVGVRREMSDTVDFDASVAATGFDSPTVEAGLEYKLTKRTTLDAKIVSDISAELQASIRLGAKRFITKLTQMGVFVKIQPEEVAVGLSLTRLGHTISLPMVVADQPSAGVISWALGAPTVVWSLIRWLLVEPRRRVRKREKLERRRAENADAVAAARNQAHADINLMHNTVLRRIEQEEAKHGLIIVSARYGNLAEVRGANDEDADASPFVADVTIPLQVIVEESQLVLSKETKAELHGFHDPCPGEDKQLTLQYLFRDALHEVTVNDDEPLKIPLLKHKL